MDERLAFALVYVGCVLFGVGVIHLGCWLEKIDARSPRDETR